MPLLADPESADYDEVRPAALFAFNMFAFLDPDFLANAVKAMKAGQQPTVRPDVEKIRGAIRSLVDGRYRYTRYFGPRQHNRPEGLEQILQHNDLELYDLHNDPHENNNLARNPGEHRQLIEALNAKMNGTHRC